MEKLKKRLKIFEVIYSEISCFEKRQKIKYIFHFDDTRFIIHNRIKSFGVHN